MPLGSWHGGSGLTVRLRHETGPPREHRMTPLAILILSLSMSADAFAAAVARGAAHRPSWPEAIRAGLVFGVIEALTPIVGWALGRVASDWVESVDHWIAFGLLAAVGSKMITEALKRESGAEPDVRKGKAGAVGLVATAVGTSIDAAAIGVTLALIGANILVIALSIGATTFLLATLGLRLGGMAGARLGSTVEFVGGLALIALGTKILLEHLGHLG